MQLIENTRAKELLKQTNKIFTWDTSTHTEIFNEVDPTRMRFEETIKTLQDIFDALKRYSKNLKNIQMKNCVSKFCNENKNKRA